MAAFRPLFIFKISENTYRTIHESGTDLPGIKSGQDRTGSPEGVIDIKVLFIGDIVGSTGRKALKASLPELKSKYNPHIIIANGENAASGRGITSAIANEFSIGAFMASPWETTRGITRIFLSLSTTNRA